VGCGGSHAVAIELDDAEKNKVRVPDERAVATIVVICAHRETSEKTRALAELRG
jgi:hypothetical protein